MVLFFIVGYVVFHQLESALSIAEVFLPSIVHEIEADVWENGDPGFPYSQEDGNPGSLYSREY